METKSRTEHLIEELMRQLDPDSPRYRVLASARQFKSSWVDLGEKLSRVMRKHLYREWGYREFDEYCGKEIRIRRQTAQKLTQAYHFLEKEAPEFLAEDPARPAAPDFRSVELLRQAQEEQALDDEQFGNLRRAVLEEHRSLPTVRRQFNHACQEQIAPATAVRRQLTAALQACRRLQDLITSLPISAGDLPEKLSAFDALLEESLGELPGEENVLS